MHRLPWVVGGLLFPALCLMAQSVQVRPAPLLEIPTTVDGNSPSFWRENAFRYLTSTGKQVILRGSGPLSLGNAESVQVHPEDHLPMWIESAWVDADGTIYGWYHNEPYAQCKGNDLTAPRIGAVFSTDDGHTFIDLGLIITSGDPIDCTAKNGFFAGGNGDFSVILDREQSYFYFFFTHYGGSVDSQGVGVARMPFQARANPSGEVRKYYEGKWNEPGIGGRLTPVFPARVSWQRADTNSFWGPAIHWNTYLESFVILLNNSCCSPGWPQEGVYVSFNRDLSDPSQWTLPHLVVRKPGAYYPQAVGLGAGETDTLSGAISRLYVQGKSKWELVFSKDPPPGADETGAVPEVPATGSLVVIPATAAPPAGRNPSSTPIR